MKAAGIGANFSANTTNSGNFNRICLAFENKICFRFCAIDISPTIFFLFWGLIRQLGK
jgi:hypothetical protein